jgi:hypothetical protein
MKRAREEGVEGLKHKPPPGALPPLNQTQRTRSKELMSRDAEAYGFRGKVWTCARVAELIRKEFGVGYHPAHVTAGCSGGHWGSPCREAPAPPGEPEGPGGGYRAPETPALARAEKGAMKEGRTVSFVDQDRSGFYLLPAVVRTYAPIGRTPVLREELSRDHLFGNERDHFGRQAIDGGERWSVRRAGRGQLSQACPTPDPGQAFDGLWDGSPIHRSKAVKKFLEDGGGFWAAAGAATRLYAPELNPDEGIWKHLKYVELKNICCRSLSELRVELRKAKERLRHKKHIILGCIRQAGFKI